MEKAIGIWIDKREAKIMSFTEKTENFQIIQSNVEEFHPSGGSGTKVKGGPQNVVQDSKYLERESHQITAFFKVIIDQIKDADSLVIFGPAQTGMQLRAEISKSHPALSKNVQSVEKADSMTDNQTKAWVRNYFSE